MSWPWPAARAEEELELEAAAAEMGMGDVAQQSVHEGGEMGHGGARVSVAAEGGDMEGRPTCCVCMEPWTGSGAHRICCIPCGHVYGRSCLESWISRGGNTSAECPQCGKRFTLEHIINLYVPGNLWDGSTCTGCHMQASVTSGPSASDTDLFKQVLDILLEPANIEKEHGVHFDEIMKRFKLPKEKILQAIEYNMDCGHIYSTIDDFHFMTPFIECHPSVQAPVTSGPSGPEPDLCKQVLDIHLEPANIEKKHGVHFDEIVKRFKLPEEKIWDAIVYHLEMGSIYCTIDDYHYVATR